MVLCHLGGYLDDVLLQNQVEVVDFEVHMDGVLVSLDERVPLVECKKLLVRIGALVILEADELDEEGVQLEQPVKLVHVFGVDAKVVLAVSLKLLAHELEPVLLLDQDFHLNVFDFEREVEQQPLHEAPP